MADGTRTRRSLIGAVAALAVAVLVAFGAWVVLAGRSAGTDVVVDVPAGAGARLDAGEPLSLVPSPLELRVGDRLVVRNQDDRVHVLGPFTVRPGETLTHTFDDPGRFVGACTVHPSGELAIVVR